MQDDSRALTHNEEYFLLTFKEIFVLVEADKKKWRRDQCFVKIVGF